MNAKQESRMQKSDHIRTVEAHSNEPQQPKLLLLTLLDFGLHQMVYHSKGKWQKDSLGMKYSV